MICLIGQTGGRKMKTGKDARVSVSGGHCFHGGSCLRRAGMRAAMAVALILCAGGWTPAQAASTNDIVQGEGAKVAYDISPGNDGANIAVGNDAHVFIGGGTQESVLSFGYEADTTYTDFKFFKLPTGLNIHSNTAAKEALPEGIAVGTNAYARTGSIEIGAHTLGDVAIGDTTGSSFLGNVQNTGTAAAKQLGVASTTVGTNSYSNGMFTTTYGSYNVQSSPYEAGGGIDTITNGSKNAFATVVGTLNSNESWAGDTYSGVANSIVGVANRVNNSNGAIVMGSGNQVQNSVGSVYSMDSTTKFDSVKAMQDAIINGTTETAGGATLALGGANSANYTASSQLIGVRNVLTGTEDTASAYNMLDGVGNTASNVQHVSAIGSGNTISDATTAQILGDDNKNSYTDTSIVTGVKNTLSGTKEKTSEYNIVSGAENTATSVQNMSAIGSRNTITGTTTAQVFGDTNTVSYSQHVSAIGSENTINIATTAQVLGDTNSVSRASLSQVIGSNNTLTGTTEKQSSFNLIAGRRNTASDLQYTTVTGMVNTVTNADMSQVSGYSNRVINASFSQVSGANNTLSTTGTVQNANDILTGYRNMVFNVQNVSAIGSINTIFNSKMTQLIGDNRYLSGADRSVVIGSADSNDVHMTSDDIVAVGYNSYATVTGGAAFGSESVANTVAGYAGYDPLTNLVFMNTTPTWKATRGAVSVGDATNGITRQITGVAAGTQDTDAVNVAQLKKVVFAQQDANQTEIKAGNGIQVIKTADGTYTISANITGSASPTGETTANVGTASTASTSESTEGTSGSTVSPVSKMALTSSTASNTSAAGTGSSGSAKGKNYGTTILPTTADSTSVQNGDVIVIQNVTDATNFTADDGNTAAISPTGTLSILGDGTNTETSISGDTVKVALKDDITVNSVTIKNGPSMTTSGIDAGNKKITNVANGTVAEGSTDAVNGGQLYEVKNMVSDNDSRIAQMDNRIGSLGHRINKAGANAAALAALHPIDYDPDDKWNFAAGVGHYHDANAAAIGAFYRPNEDIMFSVGAGFGNGENMLNAGISFHVGQGKNTYPTSRKIMAKTIDSLNKTVAAQSEKLAAQDAKITSQDEKIEKLEAMLEKQQAMIENMAKQLGQ